MFMLKSKYRYVVSQLKNDLESCIRAKDRFRNTAYKLKEENVKLTEDLKNSKLYKDLLAENTLLKDTIELYEARINNLKDPKCTNMKTENL